MKKKEDDDTPRSRHISRQFRATDIRHNIMHLLPPLIRQPTPSNPMPSQLQIPILLTLRHIMVQRPHILRWRPVAPSADFTAVLGDFDTRFFRLHPVDVFDGGKVFGLHEGFDVAVVANAAEIFFGFFFEGFGLGLVGEAFFVGFAGVLGGSCQKGRGRRGLMVLERGSLWERSGENDEFPLEVALACVLCEKIQ